VEIEMEALKIDLFQAYYDARRNKRNTINQLHFEIDYERQLLELYEQIVDRTYRISDSIAFVVNVPVKREIFAADFRDRIVHHLIFNYINPVIEAQLIDSCYSCRKGRGTLYGIRQMEQFMKDCSQNYSSDCYVLKLDIRSYFMSINKHLLWDKLQKMLLSLRNSKKLDLEILWWLIDKVLWNHPEESCFIKGKLSDWDDLPFSKSLFHTSKDCGLPIGNLTSQLFSNVYLYDFDCYIKNELGVEYYGRYVDDFVLIHPDKEFLLQAKDKIKAYLSEHCRLELHPHKIYLQHYQKGFAFLGAYIKPYRVYIANRTKKKFIQTLYQSNLVLSQKPPSKKELESIRSSVNSYLGLMKHYKTYKIWTKLLLDKDHPPLIFKYGYLNVISKQSMVFKIFQ
jgi:hypothetical protein